MVVSDGGFCCGAGQVEVEQARICYGGVAPKCIMATNAQAALEGQPWSQATLDAALLAVAKDVNITPDAPGLPAAAAVPAAAAAAAVAVAAAAAAVAAAAAAVAAAAAAAVAAAVAAAAAAVATVAAAAAAAAVDSCNQPALAHAVLCCAVLCCAVLCCAVLPSTRHVVHVVSSQIPMCASAMHIHHGVH